MKRRFAVQEHHASRLHFDFRLEMEGVLRSWAGPKGPSMDPADKRLAVEVEEHPLEYIDFEGAIPEGEYGAGQVVIWDQGPYELFEMKEGKMVFRLEGEKLRGKFSLVRLKKSRTGKDWLLIKQKDEHALPGWRLNLVLPPLGKPIFILFFHLPILEEVTPMSQKNASGRSKERWPGACLSVLGG